MSVTFCYFCLRLKQRSAVTRVKLFTGLANVRMERDKEPLLKGKAQYGWPPCTNQFRSVAFDIANIIYSFTKGVTVMRRSIVLSLLPFQLVFPGKRHHRQNWFASREDGTCTHFQNRRRHDTQHNDTEHNDIHHKDTRHEDIQDNNK